MRGFPPTSSRLVARKERRRKRRLHEQKLREISNRKPGHRAKPGAWMDAGFDNAPPKTVGMRQQLPLRAVRRAAHAHPCVRSSGIGAVVVSVAPDSPAAVAGIEPGLTIASVEGELCLRGAKGVEKLIDAARNKRGCAGIVCHLKKKDDEADHV